MPSGPSLAKSIDNDVSKSDCAYNNRSELTSEIQTLAGQTARAVRHTLDATGRRTSEIRSGDTPVASSYGYDTAGQVTSADYGSSQTDSYAYDAIEGVCPD